jgi:hypothetical protein
MSPASSGISATSSQNYTFTFSDSNGYQAIAVADVLINTAIDGINACYVAYVPSGATTGTLYLVDDTGDAGGPFTSLTLPGTGSVSNSQCTINATGASANGSGNTLALTLPITFSQSFRGNQIFYPAARSNTLSSNWQAVGTVTVR